MNMNVNVSINDDVFQNVVYLAVLRHYSDFYWLCECLYKVRAIAIVPPFPDKQAFAWFHLNSLKNVVDNWNDFNNVYRFIQNCMMYHHWIHFYEAMIKPFMLPNYPRDKLPIELIISVEQPSTTTSMTSSSSSSSSSTTTTMIGVKGSI